MDQDERKEVETNAIQCHFPTLESKGDVSYIKDKPSQEMVMNSSASNRREDQILRSRFLRKRGRVDTAIPAGGQEGVNRYISNCRYSEPLPRLKFFSNHQEKKPFGSASPSAL